MTNSKKVILPVAAVAILGGGFFAYTQGLIPGLGEGNKVAKELKADIEALKGDKIENKLLDFAAANDKQLAADRAQIEKDLAENIDINLDYSDINTSSGAGKGTVELSNAKLSLTSLKAGPSGEMSVPNLKLSRAVADASHYFYETTGDVEFFSNEAGQKTKVVAFSQGQNNGEFKLNDKNEMTYSKGYTKDFKAIEGRGNTVVLTIAEINTEFSTEHLPDNQVDSKAKFKLTNIEPGDMIKMMFALPKPLTISVDFAFKGDDLEKAIEEYNQQLGQEMESALAAPDQQPKPYEKKPFGGDLVINDFALLIGEAGIAATADVKFDRANLEYIPTGEVNITLRKFPEFTGYIKTLLPMIPPAELDKGIGFAQEIGETSGEDVKLVIKLDGTENVTVNGKNKEQIEQIRAKHYPEMSGAVEGLEAPATIEPLPAQ